MNIFSQLIQKQTASSLELYNYKHEPSIKSSFQYAELASTHEYAICDNTLDVLFKLLVNMFAASQYICTTKIKLDYFKTILDNQLLQDNIKTRFINLFCDIQKKYRGLCRLAYIYKHKRSPLRIQTDLFLNPITDAQLNVITIVQNGQKYLFTVTDLQRIINTALSNSPNFFSSPLTIKNPYNNMPFDKSTLYNIYFHVMQNKFIISPLFHAYFLCNFNLTSFRNENEALIRKVYIDNFINSNNIDLLHIYILQMCNTSRRKMRISAKFPKQKLVEIMRPYLRMYINSSYSLDMNTRFRARDELDYHIRRFVKYNPQFGRKYINATKNIVTNRIINPITFNDKHLKIKKHASMQKYNASHLEVIEEYNMISDSDSGSGSDDE